MLKNFSDMDFPFLPNISIRTDVDSRLFLNRLSSIAKDEPDYLIKRAKPLSSASPEKFLLLTYTDANLPIGLTIILQSDEKQEYRVSVEAEATGWAEKSPDYDEYVNRIRGLVRLLLKIYNRLYYTNRRLTVPSKEQLRAKLSKYLARFFRDFVNYAIKTFLSQRSWRDYYSFIICCHRRNEYLGAEELEYLLKEAGFNDYYCAKLRSIFEHGWDLLDQLPESKLRAWRKKMREKLKQEQENHSSRLDLDK